MQGRRGRKGEEGGVSASQSMCVLGRVAIAQPLVGKAIPAKTQGEGTVSPAMSFRIHKYEPQMYYKSWILLPIFPSVKPQYCYLLPIATLTHHSYHLDPFARSHLAVRCCDSSGDQVKCWDQRHTTNRGVLRTLSFQHYVGPFLYNNHKMIAFSLQISRWLTSLI